MLIERTDVIKLGDKFATVIGEDVRVGQPAPRFTAQVGAWAGLNIWAEVDVLAQTAGQVRIIAAVPSLSTSICDTETRRFNTAASALGAGVSIITISTDLPPTLKNWCAAAGVERVYTISDHLDMNFGIHYATYIKERRWHRRAVFVVGRDDRLVYVAYMPSLGDQPDYDAVLAAAQQAAAQQAAA